MTRAGTLTLALALTRTPTLTLTLALTLNPTLTLTQVPPPQAFIAKLRQVTLAT